MTEKALTFPCGDITLEGRLGLPEGAGPFPGVVVCHPHPLYGGAMDNNIVIAVCRALGGASIATLRFNFRGVGRSGGRFADGVGEQEDARAALSSLSATDGIDGARLGLCGYSFGSMVAIPLIGDDIVQALAAVSPVGNLDPLRGFGKPVLLIAGGGDGFVPLDDVKSLADELGKPVILEVIPGADHFWWGCEGEVASRVASFFAEALRPQPQG